MRDPFVTWADKRGYKVRRLKEGEKIKWPHSPDIGAHYVKMRRGYLMDATLNDRCIMAVIFGQGRKKFRTLPCHDSSLTDEDLVLWISEGAWSDIHESTLMPQRRRRLGAKQRESLLAAGKTYWKAPKAPKVQKLDLAPGEDGQP